MTALGVVVLLLAFARGIRAACWKHSTCGACISETFHGGSCLWYEQPNANHSAAWSCVAGMVGPSRTIEEAAKIVGSSHWSTLVEDGYETWPADFTVLHVDTLSEDSCFLQQCQIGATCPLGYYAVENRPCYPNGVHPEYREVRCCRQQRNTDGYLRGINEEGGVVKGRLFYSSCCKKCAPGYMNVGCGSYKPGTCELCAAGSFNPSVEAGSTCSKCMPCPAGQRRVNCGPSSPGRCEDCMPGRFKTQGLEGDAQDECLTCSTARCPNAAVRTGCGLADPGHCESCPQGSYYAQPYCRDCSTCGSFRRDVGCGGRADSTCTECPIGQYAAQDGKCTPCASCADQLNSTSAAGFNLTGSMVRVGCGASAPGECVRLGALLGGAWLSTHCPTEQLPDALCPGTSLKLRWAIEGNTGSTPQLAAGGSDCSSTDGVCLTGRWQVALWKRSVEQAAGLEVQMLGEWQLDEVETLAVGDVSGTRHLFYLKVADLHALAGDLEGGSGYFVRLTFRDYGKTCCAGLDSSPLTVDTSDFDIGRPGAAVETSLREAEVSMQNGDWQEALGTLNVACTAASVSNLACERARALQMGVATDLAFRPLPLPPVVIAPALQAKQAASPVDDMRTVLAVWEDLSLRVIAEQAFNLTAWGAQADSATLANTSNVAANSPDFATLENSSNATANNTHSASLANSSNATANRSDADRLADIASEVSAASGRSVLADTASEVNAAERGSAPNFNKLADIASEVSAAANATMNLWQQEVDDSLQSLTRVLTDLKDIDSRLHNAAWTIGFDVVRMAQSMTRSLQKTLAAGPPAGENSRIAWYATAVHGIGNVALMMLGTWREDWRHTLPWQVVAEVGVAVPGDLASETSFGGVRAGPDTVPLDEARGRVWQPFRQVAEAWISQLAADIAAANKTSTRLRRVAESSPAATATGLSGMLTIRRLGESLSNPRRTSGSSSLRLQDLAGVIDEINGFMTFIEDVTEKLVGPLSQTGSHLLAGELPDIMGCGPKLRCISKYVSTLSQKLAVDIAMHGLGPRAYRPWVDPNVDNLRQRHAAAEIISLMQGRALLFEGLLLQMLDIRYTKSEPHDLAKQVERANSAVKQFSSLGDQISVSALGSNGTQLTWRWRHGWNELQESLDTSWRAAIHLGRRKLGQLEQLVAFTNPVAEESLDSWRIPWRPALASTLLVSEAAAIAELESSLSQVWARRGEVAYLRIEANTETWPVALSSLARNGETLLRLEAPPGMHGVLMHTEAHAFLLSPRVYGSQALQPVQSESTAAESPINLTVREPHIELQLRHIGSGTGELPHTAAPFITRHERSKCAPLGDDATLKEDSYGDAALRPLYGTWLLSARDGTSLEQLVFDEGTSLRLLIKVDIPSGRPPWQLVRGIHDALYLMPADNDCDSLTPLFGFQARSSTIDPNRATTTTTASSLMILVEQPTGDDTPSVRDTADPSVEPEPELIQRPGGFMTTQAPNEASSEAFSSFLWTLPVVCLASICLCCLLVYARFRHSLLAFLQRKMPWLVRRQKSLVTASDATFDSPSPKGAEKLRYRLPSPKAHESPPLPSQVSMSPGQLDALRASAAHCERPAPRSSAPRGPRKGGRGSGHRDDSDGESWGDAAETPPGSSDESSSSGSSTSRSSSSESSLEPAHPPAFAQPDSRAGKVAEEDTKPLQSTGAGCDEGDGSLNNAHPALDNNSAGNSNSTGTPRGGARTDSAESPPGATGHTHPAAAATAATAASRELAAPPATESAAHAAAPPTAAAASESAAAELDAAESAVMHNTAPGIGGEPAADDPPEMLT